MFSAQSPTKEKKAKKPHIQLELEENPKFCSEETNVPPSIQVTPKLHAKSRMESGSCSQVVDTTSPVRVPQKFNTNKKLVETTNTMPSNSRSSSTPLIAVAPEQSGSLIEDLFQPMFDIVKLYICIFSVLFLVLVLKCIVFDI